MTAENKHGHGIIIFGNESCTVTVQKNFDTSQYRLRTKNIATGQDEVSEWFPSLKDALASTQTWERMQLQKVYAPEIKNLQGETKNNAQFQKANEQNHYFADFFREDEVEDVIQFGGELCGIDVQRWKTDGTVKYRLHIEDYSSSELLDEPENDVDVRTEWVSGLEQALTPSGSWTRLRLLKVAPDLEEEVLRIAEPYPRIIEQFKERKDRQNQKREQTAKSLLKKNDEFADQGNFKGIIDNSTKIIELIPNSARAYIDRAFGCWGIKDWKGVVANLSQAITLGNLEPPLNHQAFSNRGNAYMEMGEFELAIADHNEAMKLLALLGKDDGTSLVGRGDAFYGLGDYGSAIADYSDVIKLYPNSFDALIRAHYGLGMVFERTGEAENAKLEFAKAEELAKKDKFPELIEILEHDFANMDRIRIAKERDAAPTGSTKAIEPDPMNAEAYFRRAVYKHSIEEDWEGAIADYSRAISLGTLEPSDHLNALQNRGELYAEVGEFELAIADLKSFPEGAPSHYGLPYVKRGDAHCGLGNYDSAIADYSEAIKFHQDPFLAVIPGHYGLGVVYERVGEAEKAKSEFAKAEELAKEHNKPDLIERIKAYRSNTEKMRMARGLKDGGPKTQKMTKEQNKDKGPEEKDKAEIALKFGAEGGSLTIERKKIDGIFKYRVHLKAGLGDEDWPYEDECGRWVSSLEEVLTTETGIGAVKDWPHLYLLQVAPDLEDEFLRLAKPHPRIIEQIMERISRRNQERKQTAKRLLKKNDELAKQRNFKGIIDNSTKVIELDPNCAKAYYNRGRAYLAVGEFELAIADLDKGMEMNARAEPKVVLKERGDAHYGLGNYASAIADYCELVNYASAMADDWEVIKFYLLISGHYGLGVVYERIGEAEKAKSEFAKAEELVKEYGHYYSAHFIDRKAYFANLEKMRMARESSKNETKI